VDKNLKKLLIKTKKSVFSQMIGNNTSRFKGEGYDFAELREYEDGEDVRKIDWVISAKIGKPYVKVFHAQRQLDINVVALMGGGVYFGTHIQKQELITQISSMIGYSAIASNDNFASFIATDSLQLITKKSKNIKSVEYMAQTMYHYPVIGKTIEYHTLKDQLFKQVPQKSILFLVGDFLECEDLDLKLLAKKHELIAIVVRDRFEEDPSSLGGVEIVDPATLQRLEFELGDKEVKQYTKYIQSYDLKLFKKFQKWGVEFVKVYTDENPLVKLLKLFR
jgi:uncharacterized protein (DUF58 family)